MRFGAFVPLVIFAIIGVGLAVGLTLNPREIPSALIGRPVPEFDLPPLLGRTEGFRSADLRAGEVSVVNVFASWCVPCRVEHPLLMELQRSKAAPVYGINYKDEPQAAQRFLAQLGDPFRRAGADLQGRTGIDWGVYGVPETFVVDGEGRIRCKHIGPLTEHDLTTKILPLVSDLKAGRPTAVKCS